MRSIIIIKKDDVNQSLLSLFKQRINCTIVDFITATWNFKKIAILK